MSRKWAEDQTNLATNMRIDAWRSSYSGWSWKKTASIVVEPLGPEGDGVEFVVSELDGCKTYYQCKASNVGSGGWSLSDLNRQNL